MERDPEIPAGRFKGSPANSEESLDPCLKCQGVDCRKVLYIGHERVPLAWEECRFSARPNDRVCDKGGAFLTEMIDVKEWEEMRPRHWDT